jgi:steroid 5-alpha reductase family enzyme
MRRRWSAKGGQLWVYFMAFTYVFMMQAAFSVLINRASLKVCLDQDKESQKITTLDIIGSVVFAVGFLMEAISDH